MGGSLRASVVERFATLQKSYSLHDTSLDTPIPSIWRNCQFLGVKRQRQHGMAQLSEALSNWDCMLYGVTARSREKTL